MKKVALTITAVLFALTVVIADDNKEAQHSVSIEIPTVALVDVEDADGEAQTINLTPDVSAIEAGEAVDFSTATDNSFWLNYTSVVAKNKKRNITAKIESGDLPEGVSLVLSVGGISTGNGTKGEAVSGTITLGKNAKDIVKNIGSCYTESGSNKGHQLTYSLDMDNSSYDELIADSYSVEVVYTITDN
jgi:hypothetical protein